MTRDDVGLIDFVASFLTKSYSRGVGIIGLPDYVGRRKWRMNLNNIKDFVDLEKIQHRVREIYSSEMLEKLTDDKKLALKIFLDTIDGKIKDDFPNP